MAVVSVFFLSAGLYMVLDSLLLNAYKFRSSGIIIACIGSSGLLIAFALRNLHRKSFKTEYERQITEAHLRIVELERELAAVQDKLLAADPDGNSQPDNSEIALSAWAKAVEEYKADRKNDSLPDRMRVLLRYLGGEKFSDIAQDMPGKNLSVYLKKAKEVDVPKLKSQFSILPELNLSASKTVGKL
jgi:hypothetical protein